MLVPEWRVMIAALSVSSSAGFCVEVRATRRDKTTFPFEITLSPLNTDEGLLVTAAIRDITERKRIDEDIRELNIRLEQRVAQRTRELSEANEALRQSNDDLSQFACAASHDLQEPLRFTASFFRSATRSDWTRRPTGRLGFIISGAERMEMLLRDLLVYSQTGSDQEPAVQVNCVEALAKVTLDLQAVIE